LDGLKKLEQRSHKCVEPRGEYVEYKVPVLKFVPRIRLVKTETRSACVTVKCKVCRSAKALYCL
jgi:hypothetical protein